MFDSCYETQNIGFMIDLSLLVVEQQIWWYNYGEYKTNPGGDLRAETRHVSADLSHNMELGRKTLGI